MTDDRTAIDHWVHQINKQVAYLEELASATQSSSWSELLADEHEKCEQICKRGRDGR